MQIFLGKNWLGQSDKQEINLPSIGENPMLVERKYDMTALSEDELISFKAILTKCKIKDIAQVDFYEVSKILSEKEMSDLMKILKKINVLNII